MNQTIDEEDLIANQLILKSNSNNKKQW